MATNYGSLSVLVRADTTALAKSVQTNLSRAGDTAAAGFGDHFERSSRGLGSRIGGVLKTGAKVIGVGAAAAGAAIVPMFKTGMAAQDEWLKQQANLQAGLKSTHNAANTSVKGMQDLASSISGYSGQSGLAIQNAEQLLLTFPQIRNEAGKNNDIFNQATAITADMAQRLGKDAPSAAIMLGKALNDPIKGVTSLRRVGVQLNEQQTEQVKKLTESGDVMGAQKIIIGELNHEFGGSAKMYGKTLPGQIAILRNSFKGAERQMVAELEPALSSVVGTVTKEVLPAFKSFTSQLGPALAPVLKTVAGLISNLAPLFGTVLQQVVPIITQLGRMFAPIITALTPILRQLVTVLSGAVVSILKALTPVMPIIGQLAAMLGRVLVGALKALQPLWRPLGALLKVAMDLFRGLMNAVGPLIPVIMRLVQQVIVALMPAFTVLIRAIRPLIPPLVQLVRIIATQFMRILIALMPIIRPLGLLLAQGLGEALQALVPLIRMLLPIIGFLARLLGTILVGAIKFLMPILRVVIKIWGWYLGIVIKFWKFVAKSLIAVIRFLARVSASAWRGIQTAVRFAWEKIIRPAWNAMHKAINVLADVFRWLWHRVIQPVWNGIKRAISVVWNWIRKWIFTPIHNAVDQLGAVFRWLWHKVIQPVWGGIKSTIRIVWGWIKRYVFNPIHAAVDALGDAMRWLWHKIIEPVWNGIKNAIQWPWNHIIKPILDAFHNAPDALARVWRGFKRAIGVIFDNVKKAVGTPIYFVADKILKPIINGINWLITKIGIPKIPVEWIQSIPHFAEGGRVPGGWGGGDRIIAAVEPGEWVLTKRQARAIGYSTLRGLPRFTEGGMVGGGGEGGVGISPYFNWNPLHYIGAAAKGLWNLGKDVVAAGGKLLRSVAADAFEAAMKPLRNMAQPYANMKVPPGNAMWQFIGKLMLQVIDKAIAFIRGHSEEDIAAAGPGEIAQKAVEVAIKQIGKPYVYGAHGPGSFDCSGLVEYSYRMAGYPKGKIPGPRDAIGGYTGTQVQHGTQVSEASAIPGDLVFYFRPGNWPKDPHHVAIATSANEVIQAPDVGMNVTRSSPFSAAGMSGDRRMVRRLVKEQMGGVLGAVTPGAFGVFSALRSLGWSPAQAAGICGNIDYESGFDPMRVQGPGHITSPNPDHGPNVGYGLVQWTPGSKLAAYLRWGNKDNTLANQLWALNEQLRGRGPYPEGPAGAMLRSAKNAFQAGLIFGDKYERFSTDTSYGRAAQSRIFYDKWRHRGKFDQGGYLMPGINVTENLTRKPEPVLTNDQWRTLTAAATANRRGSSGPHYIAGGSLDIGIDSQGRMRAWVQDMVLEEAEYAGSFDRMGGGGW